MFFGGPQAVEVEGFRGFVGAEMQQYVLLQIFWPELSRGDADIRWKRSVGGNGGV